MMQPKRICFLLLVVALLTFCTLSAFASVEGETSFGITVSSKYDAVIEGVDNTLGVQKDSVVNFSVNADEVKVSPLLMLITVTYDPSALELTADGVKISEQYDANNSSVTGEDTPGYFELNYLDYKGAGELATFSFTVKDTHGNTNVVVEAQIFSQQTWEEIPAALTGATTTIGVHSYGEAKTVNPDCTNGGYTYRACTVENCAETIILERTGALNHKYGDWAVTTAPTVDATGLLTKTCEHDETHTETFELPALSTANGYTYAVTTPEKCEVKGVGTYTYNKDGQTFTFDVERAALDHEYGAWSVTTAPTVDATGLLTKACKHDTTHTVTFELPALSEENGYTYEITTPEKCEVIGMGKFTYVKDEQNFAFDVERAALEHKYGAWELIETPTATAGGLLLQICEHDGSHMVKFELPVLDEENSYYKYEIVTNETCVTPGAGKFTYVQGDQTFTFDVVRAALGHKYGAWELIEKPTETSGGLLLQTCEHDASHMVKFELPVLNAANGYDYAVTKAEKCEETGVGTYTYKKDGQTFTFDVDRAALGHKYGAWSVTTAPTVDAIGLLTKTCEHDEEHTVTFELPALSTENGYTYAVTTPEECEVKGVGTYTYEKDGQTFTFDVDRAALGHKYGAWVVTTAPTVEAAGLLTKTCEHDAEHTVTFELPALSEENGYTYEITTPEECEVTGMGKFTYVKDEQTFAFDVERAALGHDETGAAATCTTDKVCARENCDFVLAEKLGHDETGAAATCTTDKVCARENCDFVLAEKLGHDETGAAATCTTDKVCARENCNEVLEAKHGHNEDGDDATLTSDKLCANGCGTVLEAKNTGGLVALIIVIVLVVLAGGGFAAYWFIFKKKA